MVKFKDFSRPLNVFQVLFKANLIFKDSSRQACIFKYFSSLCEPCYSRNLRSMFCITVYSVCLCWCFTSQSTIFQSSRDVFQSSWIEPVLLADKVSCSRTQHSDPVQSRTSTPSISNLTPFRLSQCAPPHFCLNLNHCLMSKPMGYSHYSTFYWW